MVLNPVEVLEAYRVRVDVYRIIYEVIWPIMGHRDHPRQPAPNSMNELVDDATIDDATARIAPHVMRSPLFRSAGLSDDVGVDVFVKAELFQPTGSFKLRGVFNKALTLSDDENERGLIAFSAGNHAMAVAHVGAGLGVPVTVCMPAGAVRFKVDAVKALGANLELVDGDLVAHAMRRQEQLNATLIHPFDDPAVIAGTATIGRELLADLPDVDIVIVPVGGGSLISGVAAAVKRHNRNAKVIGVEPDTADVVTRSLSAGHPVPHPGPKSLADGLNAPVTGKINPCPHRPLRGRNRSDSGIVDSLRVARST